jgi:uncharacterized repeat protein (TIGR04138 family)
MFHPKLAEIVRKDPRFPYEAYEFLFAALTHTQKSLGLASEHEGRETPENHITGRQLLEGIRDLALQEFGLMARTVFRLWGVHRTADVGDIVFNLIDANLLSKTDRDSRQDFEDVFDLDEALTRPLELDWQEAD